MSVPNCAGVISAPSSFSADARCLDRDEGRRENNRRCVSRRDDVDRARSHEVHILVSRGSRPLAYRRRGAPLELARSGRCATCGYVPAFLDTTGYQRGVSVIERAKAARTTRLRSSARSWSEHVVERSRRVGRGRVREVDEVVTAFSVPSPRNRVSAVASRLRSSGRRQSQARCARLPELVVFGRRRVVSTVHAAAACSRLRVALVSARNAGTILEGASAFD